MDAQGAIAAIGDGLQHGGNGVSDPCRYQANVLELLQGEGAVAGVAGGHELHDRFVGADPLVHGLCGGQCQAGLGLDGLADQGGDVGGDIGAVSSGVRDVVHNDTDGGQVGRGQAGGAGGCAGHGLNGVQNAFDGNQLGGCIAAGAHHGGGFEGAVEGGDLVGAQVCEAHAGVVAGGGGLEDGQVVVVVVGISLNDRLGLACGGDQCLQLDQGVGGAAVIGLGGQGADHGGQVFGGDAAQAQGFEGGHVQGADGRCACDHGLQGVGGVDQHLQLGNRVHAAAGFAADDGVEQVEVVAVGSAAQRHADAGVVSRLGAGAGVGHGAVGPGEDVVVRGDQVADVGGGGELRGCHGGGGQSRVDGGQVHAGDQRFAAGVFDACVGVGAQGGRCTGVDVGVVLNLLECLCGCSHDDFLGG